MALFSSPRALAIQFIEPSNSATYPDEPFLEDHNLPPMLHFLAFWGNMKLLKSMVENEFVDIDEIRAFQCHPDEMHPSSLSRWLNSTALHVAAPTGPTDVIDYLIQTGLTKVDQKNETGGTALHVAVDQENMLSVAALISNNASKTQRRGKETPLQLYLSSKSLEKTVDSLIVLGVGEGTILDYKGATVLHVLARYHGVSTETLKYFADQENDINCHDDIGYTPLRRAVAALSWRNVKSFLSFGCRAQEDMDKFGNTLLHCVCQSAWSETEWLDKFGRQTMSLEDILRVRIGFVKVFNLLTEHGIDPNACNNSGQTALELWIIACKYEYVVVRRHEWTVICPEYIEQHSMSEITGELAKSAFLDAMRKETWLWLIERTPNAKTAMIRGLEFEAPERESWPKKDYWV
ncbi:hypothetical protein MMC10_004984 [Thelotrema lepadinum]|nr:hypothetical protein [Thelotrema lepadinum]